MSYRNKTYVCLDYDEDCQYYNLMKAWKENEHIDFNFYNAHDLNNLRDGSQEETIKRKLRERMNASKVLIVLIGKNTRNLHKFVRWEQSLALERGIPIIAVNLNGSRKYDPIKCPPVINNELVVHISFGQKIIKYALDNWQDEYYKLKIENVKGARVYSDDIYERIGQS